jgi:hypothetical protein
LIELTLLDDSFFFRHALELSRCSLFHCLTISQRPVLLTINICKRDSLQYLMSFIDRMLQSYTFNIKRLLLASLKFHPNLIIKYTITQFCRSLLKKIILNIVSIKIIVA